MEVWWSFPTLITFLLCRAPVWPSRQRDRKKFLDVGFLVGRVLILVFCLLVRAVFLSLHQHRRLDHHPQTLFVCAFECEEHVAHVARDEHHRGEGHAPADPLPPGWEHVVAHGEGNHLHCTEQEHSLDLRDKETDLSISVIMLTDSLNCRAAQLFNYDRLLCL